MRRLLFLLVFSLFTCMSYAQEAKPDCQPKSCSIKDKKSCAPGDTKVSEAKVITTLRSELQALKSEQGLDGEILPGKNDDESVEILIEEFDTVMKSYEQESVDLGATKAQKIANMRKIITGLESK